jgi:hypothetical protein
VVPVLKASLKASLMASLMTPDKTPVASFWSVQKKTPALGTCSDVDAVIDVTGDEIQMTCSQPATL